MTQEYLSRKVVTAWPELRYEGEIPEGAPEGYKGEPVHGYGVKYENGHISWSPKEAFEAASIALGNIIHLPAFQVRLLAERAELNDRVVGLGRFLAMKKDLPISQVGMSQAQFDLLNKQHGIMASLLEVLDARIEEMSNPADIAALFQPDPNLEHEQGYIEKIADVKPIRFGSDWLQEQLRAASDIRPGDFVNQWTQGSGEKTVIAKVPTDTAKYNLIGLLTAQGQMPEDADITDVINFVGVDKVVDASGNLLEIEKFEYLAVEHREFQMGLRLKEGGMMLINIDRERCVATMSPTGFPKDAKIHLAVTLFNENRRPAQ